jgi:acid phosphatase family membrane protein YuiD
MKDLPKIRKQAGSLDSILNQLFSEIVKEDTTKERREQCRIYATNVLLYMKIFKPNCYNMYQHIYQGVMEEYKCR